MLSDPNVKKIMPKVGNRYEVALAIAKRARAISEKRCEENDPDIKDPVDIAAKEIAEEESYVKKDGTYVIDPKIEHHAKEDEEEKGAVKE